jgi:hypothetical protein
MSNYRQAGELGNCTLSKILEIRQIRLPHHSTFCKGVLSIFRTPTLRLSD